ncbi:tetratricopeptide repeat protein [Rhizobium grahamii]|uniref:Uncharacterized protein n=1 Tax=Rhizobium grahamii TaxID=1120045 RepID=A0A370KDN5_9HYPH|nr:tetratricopeptide repeat protein [Rhizobium grahamii]RDJ01008.1 hypothetical protein B5K06_34290 [Rhizobium grahamii]
MNVFSNLDAAGKRSLASICVAISALLPLSGCARSDKASLSVKETPPPELLGAKDIDPAMRERILRNVGQYADERTLRIELQNQPGNVDAAIRLTKALLAQNRPHEALKVLDSVLPTARNNPRVLNARGVVFDIEGQHEVAQGLYNQALKFEPDNQMLRNNLDLSLALGGKSERRSSSGSTSAQSRS